MVEEYGMRGCKQQCLHPFFLQKIVTVCKMMDRQGGHMMTTFMPIFITIISGVFVFIIGRFIEKLFIDPMKEHKMVIAEIYDGLIYHANKIGNPLAISSKTDPDALKEYNQASNELRRMSTKLRAATFNLNGVYWIYRLIFWGPKKKNISEVCRALIGLSNCLTYITNIEHIERNSKKTELIMEKLKLTKFESKIQK